MQRKIRVKHDPFDLTDTGFITKDMAFIQGQNNTTGKILCPWTGEVIWQPIWYRYWPFNSPSPFIEHYENMIYRGHKLKPLNKYSYLE